MPILRTQVGAQAPGPEQPSNQGVQGRYQRPVGAPVENKKSFSWASLKPLLNYHVAVRTAFNTGEATLAGCNAITGDSETKKSLANITTYVAIGNAVLRSYAAYRSLQEGNFGQCSRHAACCLLEVAVSACFIHASALTGDVTKDQKTAETFVYWAIGASVAKVFLDFVFDCIEIHNQLKNEVNHPEVIDIEAGGNVLNTANRRIELLESKLKTAEGELKTAENKLTDVSVEKDNLKEQIQREKNQRRREASSDQEQMRRMGLDIQAKDRTIRELQGSVDPLEAQPSLSHHHSNTGLSRRRSTAVSIASKQFNTIEDKPHHFWVTNSEFLQKETAAINENDLGVRYLREGNSISAHKCFTHSAQLSEELGRKSGKALSFSHLGQLHKYLATVEDRDINLNKALVYYSNALTLNQQLGRHESVFNNSISIGRLLMEIDFKDKALESYNEAFKIIRQNPSQYNQEVIERLDRVDEYKQKNEPKEAIRCYEECLEFINFEQENEMDYHSHWGAVFHAHNDFERAIGHYEKSFAISETLGLNENTASLLGHLGCAYQDKGTLKEAITCYEKAVDMDDVVGATTIGRANNLSNLGNAYKLKGDETGLMSDYKSAVHYHQEALKMNQQLGANDGQAANHATLGLINSIQGKNSEARSAYLEAKKLYGESQRASIVQRLMDKLPAQAGSALDKKEH